MEKIKKVTKLNHKVVTICAFLFFICFTIASVHGISVEENNKDRYDVKIKKYATETSEGIRVYISKKTGKAVFTEKIPMTGHQWGKWEIAKKPTYSEDGYKIRRCIRHPHLNHVSKEVLVRSGPKWSKWIIDRKATKTRDGLKHRIDLLHKGRIEYKIIPKFKNILKKDEENGISTDKMIFNSNVENDRRDKPENQTPDNAFDNNDSKQNSETESNRGLLSGEGSEPVTGRVPFGFADVAIVFANGAVAVFWWILLLPLVKVMFWIEKKKREAEENSI